MMKKKQTKVTVYGFLLLYLIEHKFPTMNQNQRYQLKKNNRYSGFRCHKCDSRLKVEKGQFDNHLYCVKCFSHNGTYTTENGDCCKKPNFIFVKQLIADGRFQLRTMCTHCFKKSSNSIPHKECPNMDELPIFNYLDYYDIKHIRTSERDNLEIAIRDLRTKKLGIITDNNIDLDFYEKYLKSPEWKIKRKIVLIRDKNLCQSCLCNEATDVHHITYRHLGNEPLFELVSVCRECHFAIYNMDKDYDSKKIVHDKLLKTLLRA